jgi:ABC-type multidrug transport system permease subunit
MSRKNEKRKEETKKKKENKKIEKCEKAGKKILLYIGIIVACAIILSLIAWGFAGFPFTITLTNSAQIENGVWPLWVWFLIIWVAAAVAGIAVSLGLREGEKKLSS